MPHHVSDEPLPLPEVDLHAPFISDTILEVRTGRMKPLPGLTVQSGIDKTLRHGPVRVTELGLEGDEHDPTFHGGLDKAIHGCKSTTNPQTHKTTHLPVTHPPPRLLLPLPSLALRIPLGRRGLPTGRLRREPRDRSPQRT